MNRKRVVIMGAAGRDFHDFNVVYRADPATEVVAFTATQIPGIAGRRYPPQLAGPLYPDGIAIVPEERPRGAHPRPEGRQRRVRLQRRQPRDGDARRVTRSRGRCRLRAPGAPPTMLAQPPPGHRGLCDADRGRARARPRATWRRSSPSAASSPSSSGTRCRTAISPPRPSSATRTYADLDRYDTTIEEREEYEPHLDAGRVVYAGVDYEAILRAAEAEADVILWDGGNNDYSFYRPDLYVVVADPLRNGDERRYHPGETNVRLADVVIINKIDSAEPAAVEAIRASVRDLNPRAEILTARSDLTLVGPPIEGRRVVVVEDGPTLTHGGMTYGAGVVAARRFGAARLVDPRPAAVGSIREVLDRYPMLEPLVPAMGYGESQIRELEATLNAVDADLVLCATPIDLTRVLTLNKPMTRVRYELVEAGGTPLADLIEPIVRMARAPVLAATRP